MLISSSFPSFRNDRKKNQREKRKVSEGQFSHQKRRKIVERRDQFYTITNGKYRGENARANTLLSINKTPNNTSSLHQISGFLRPRAALYFLSSRAALYFTKTADDDDDDDDGGERKPCLPINRENRENIFFLKGCFFFFFCLLFAPRYFHSRRYFFVSTEEQKTLSPLLLSCPSLFRELELSRKKKFKKRRKRARERETQSFLFPTTTSCISLPSARDDGNDEYHHQQQERRRRKGL